MGKDVIGEFKVKTENDPSCQYNYKRRKSSPSTQETSVDINANAKNGTGAKGNVSEEAKVNQIDNLSLLIEESESLAASCRTVASVEENTEEDEYPFETMNEATFDTIRGPQDDEYLAQDDAVTEKAKSKQKIGKQCFECGMKLENSKSLKKHLCKHFRGEITILYLRETKTHSFPKPGGHHECRLCNDLIPMKSTDDLVFHLGMQHGFLKAALAGKKNKRKLGRSDYVMSAL